MRGHAAKWVADSFGRDTSERGATRSVRVCGVLILTGLLVGLGVCALWPTGMVQSPSDSGSDQRETQRSGQAHDETFDALGQRTIVGSDSTLGAVDTTLSVAPPASESSGRQTEAQQALDANAQATEIGRVSALGPSGVMPTAVQPATQPVDGQFKAQQPDTSQDAFDAQLQQTKLAQIQSGSDQVTLRDYLRDADPIIAAAAFAALGVIDKQAAVKALRDVVNDTAEPVRLQALQLLLSSPDVDEATRAAIHRAALQDPDPAFIAYAVQELGGRNDQEALRDLAEAFDTGDITTRLLIVNSIANNTSATHLLYQGLNDPDERVRNAVMAALHP